MNNAQSLALIINNNGETYKQRQHIAGISFSRETDALQRMIELAKLQAKSEDRKYKVADIKLAAGLALQYVQRELLEDLAHKVKNGAAVYARGRKWFDKTWGNTYHSVFMTVAGVSVYLPMQYGYGEQ